MDPFERGRHGKLLTEAERGSRSVLWPQGSTAIDAVYPLLHEIAPQPPSDVVYPLLSELNPQPSSDVVYPLLHELRPQPPDDVVYPLLHELRPQPPEGVVYPQIPNESLRWPSPVVFPIVQANGMVGVPGWSGGAGQQGLTELERQHQQQMRPDVAGGFPESPYIRDPQPTLLTDLERQTRQHLEPSLLNVLPNTFFPQYPLHHNPLVPPPHTTRMISSTRPSLLQEPYSQVTRERQDSYPYGVTTVDDPFQNASLYKKAMLASIQSGTAQQQPVVVPWNQIQVNWVAFDDEVSPARTGSNTGGTVQLMSTIFPGAYMIDGSFSLNDQGCTILVTNGEANEYQKVELTAKRKTFIRLSSQQNYRFALSASLSAQVSVWNPPWMINPNGTDLEAGVFTFLDFQYGNGSRVFTSIYEGNQKIGDSIVSDSVYRTLSRDFHYKRFFDDQEYFNDRFPITQPDPYKKTFHVQPTADFYVIAEFSLIARALNSWKACKLEIFSYRPQLLRL